MQNADQTYSQDLGGVTELLSGAFFIPFGRSTSHQLWSSSMVITPALRGLFGLRIDAAANTVYVDPHLPADWPTAAVKQLHVGDSICNLTFTREGPQLRARVATVSGKPVQLQTFHITDRANAGETLTFNPPAVEAAVPHLLPPLGSRTAQLKVLSQTEDTHSLTLELEAEAGTSADLIVRVNHSNLKLESVGATLGPTRADGLRSLRVVFPSGTGYRSQTVKLTWQPLP
jgi:hypothetical protein